MWLSSSLCGCSYLGATFVYHRFDVAFICSITIKTSKIYSINDKKSNQWLSICCRTEIIGIQEVIIILNV